MSTILNPGQKAALIINECQLGIIDTRYSGFPGLAQQVEERGVVSAIVRLAEVFRSKALPIFHTPVMHRADFADIQSNSLINALTLKHKRMAGGSPEADYVEVLRPQPGDFVVVRTAGLIAFNATSLDVTLRRMGVNTVVLTGVSTNVALPGNTTTAVDLGYHVIIPEDCIAGSDAVTHKTIVENQLRLLARVTTSGALISALEAP